MRMLLRCFFAFAFFIGFQQLKVVCSYLSEYDVFIHNKQIKDKVLLTAQNR